MNFIQRIILFLALVHVTGCEKAVDSGSTYKVNGTWGGSDVTVPALDDTLRAEVQGIAYRILMEPEFEAVFNVISPQIALNFQQSSNGAIHISTASAIGKAGRDNDALVHEYRRRLYEAISNRLLSEYDKQAHENEAEQDGTGQPATRPVLESEGSDKPQPESERRSR
jgi:hypothetical protein